MQAFFRLNLLIACNVLIALDIGAYGNIQRSLISTHDADMAV